MKTKLHHAIIIFLLFATFGTRLSTAFAQGTAFTYQGQLQNNGSPASGLYDFVFSLSNAPSGGSQVGGTVTSLAVGVTNGLFTTTLDFGAVFAGKATWLAIAVRTNNTGSYASLLPLQQLTPTPYAIFANTASNVSGTVSAGQLSGTVPLAQLPGAVLTNNETSVNLSGTFTGNGGGLTNLAGWQLAGNTGTANGNFLGTTDNQPLEIRVGGGRAGLISPSNGSPNIVFGPAQNGISNTTAGASILGGINNTIGTNSSYSVIGGGQQNSILNNADHSVLGGGYKNSIQTNASDSYLGGGSQNSIFSTASYSFLGGGQYNSIQSGANQSFIGGGYQNIIHTSATASVIAGGYNNTIQTGTSTSFIGGGYDNTLYANAVNSVLGGGYINSLNAGDSVLVGGEGNSIQNGASVSVIVGGVNNSIQSNNGTSFIGGGSGNIIQMTTTSGGNAFIGGGANNLIGANCGSSLIVGGNNNQIQATALSPSSSATIVGGQNNIIAPAAYYAFIGGGYLNTIGNGGPYSNAFYAVVPGGYNNYAGGPYSFAAGQRAKANYQGDFVWADSQAADFNSTSNDQFNVRANVGVRFVTGGAGLTLDGLPVLAGNISLAQLISEVVTNNEPAVSLGSLTLGGNLNLPFPASISSGGFPLLYADNNQNTYLGINAGSGGNNNTAIGNSASSLSSGSNNTAIGDGALILSSGSYNTANGYDALALNGGSYNTGNGYNAMNQNSGSGNTANGYDALIYNQSSYNTANGYEAMGGTTFISPLKGGNNTADGAYALLNNSSGSNNVANGTSALSSNTSGSGNTALGSAALWQATASGNIGIGNGSGGNLTTGNNNIDIGNYGQSGDNGIIRIGTPGTQTGAYIAGSLFLDGSDPNNGLSYRSSGLTGVPGGAGPFLFGFQGGSLGTTAPNSVALSWDFNGNVWVSNNLSTATLTIRGGADLAEPFNITAGENEVTQGAVVVIDDQNPGQLKLTDQPYDIHVAGVVSGANGINPGIQMHQQGLLEGGKNVALSGRVYVQADTSNGAIKPGDLLTTSSTPGHAMKVTDHAKAAGAILGKAMTSLSEGKGMVLVLVTLQ